MPVLEALAYLRSIEAEAAKLLPGYRPHPNQRQRGRRYIKFMATAQALALLPVPT